MALLKLFYCTIKIYKLLPPSSLTNVISTVNNVKAKKNLIYLWFMSEVLVVFSKLCQLFMHLHQGASATIHSCIQAVLWWSLWITQDPYTIKTIHN